jgi:predicted nucleotidyltransferase
MDRTTIVERIKSKEAAIRKEGATHLYLFGSRARGDNKPASDLDVLVDYDPEGKFSIFDLIGIKLLLEDELQLDVHVTTGRGLHPHMKGKFDAEAIRVF